MKPFAPLALCEVTPEDPILAERIESCRRATIPSSIAKCRDTGRIDAFKLQWKEGMPNRPHIFWDSDFAKVLEGMALMLELHPEDSALAEELDRYVELVISAQQPDGYLNTFFTAVEPDQRWKNIFDWHELYCAGHLMEAAVAHFRATGKRKFLDALCRYADYISSVFGPAPGQLRGYPGHEEIELALCKLADAGENARYLELAGFFIDERGREPNFFLEQKKEFPSNAQPWNLINRQAHKPVREQSEAVGHSVRALYLYIGMADVAARTGDRSLLDACVRIFDNLVEKRMYLTGGCGSTQLGEAFTVDYDLPNDTAYAESCASMALVQFARRMADATGEARYADIMEQALYNGALSGISLSGDRFFYANMLSVDDSSFTFAHVSKERQPWFDCSCCPTSFCRFLPQLGSFGWSQREGELRCHIPAAGTIRHNGMELKVEGRYPYDGEIIMEIVAGSAITLSFRIPGWCRSWACRLNGHPLDVKPENGYCSISREWKAGDTVELSLELPVDVVRADSRVTADAGKFALMRGPLVYALESIDNGPRLSEIVIPMNQQFKLGEATGLPGVPAVTGKAFRETLGTGALYLRNPVPQLEEIRFHAIPYALWQNRGPAELATWLRGC